MLWRSFAPTTVRPSLAKAWARDPRVPIGWPLPLGFGLDGRLLLARRGRVYVQFIIICAMAFYAPQFYATKKTCSLAQLFSG